MRTISRTSLFAAAAWLAAGSPLAAPPEAPPEPPPETPPAQDAAQPRPPAGASDDGEPAAGERVRVLMDDGDRIVGELVSADDREVIVRVAGIPVRLDRARVRRVVRERSPQEIYKAARAVIADDDTERLLLLIEGLRADRLYDEALDELGGILDREPHNPQALRLREIVEQERAMAADAPKPGDGPKPRSAPARSRRPHSVAGRFPLLDRDQRNIIKVYELDLEDPPRLRVPRETAERFWSDYGQRRGLGVTREDRQAFLEREPLDILREMFDARARELYDQVEVLDLPASLAGFRNNVHARWLVASCASSACHGGAHAGDFLLYNRRPRTEAAFLTNYLILERTALPDGRPLLDYENPRRSPLIQLGLPREDSLAPHPDVPGWRPIFNGAKGRWIDETTAWIESMRVPRVEHPVQYEPPTPASLMDDQSEDRQDRPAPRLDR